MSTASVISNEEVTRRRQTRSLNEPVMKVDLQAVATALRSENAWRDHGQSALTLIKHEDARVVLIALKAGARIKQHSTSQHLTLHTLTGQLRIHLMGRDTVALPAGQLLSLDRGIAHDIEAVEDTSLLLSMGWSNGEGSTHRSG